jgi:acetylglutamate kinase
MKPPLFIIKIGGNVLDDESELNAFLKSFSEITSPKILVHGGGKIASELGKKLGIQPVMHEGRRITDAETLDLVVMVYAGLINKKLVAKLQAVNCNSIGLCGADGSSIPATKRVAEIDYGFVGDIHSSTINIALLSLLLRENNVPVIAPITHNKDGQLLNTNADTIASALSIALSSMYTVHLIYCFEKNGVLMDASTDDSVIDKLSKSSYSKLIDKGIISGGMIPKLNNAFDAIDGGVQSVKIGHARNLNRLINFQDSGTLVTS